MAISRSFKFGGGYRQMFGDVTIREVQIHIKKHFKKQKKYTELGGRVSSLNWGSLPP